MSRSHSVRLLVFLAALALAWVIWPERSVEVERGDSVIDTSAGAEPASVDAELTESAAEEPDREELSNHPAVSGHQVRVLGVDGQPMAGVQVWLREIRADLVEDLLTYWAENPSKLRAWALPGQATPARTNEDGVAQFALRGAASAGVVIPGAMGATSFPALAEGETAEPQTIQLVAIPTIEVLVRDAQDQPLAGREVSLRLSSAHDLQGLEGEARSLRQGQGGPWRSTRVKVVSDSEGSALLPIFVTAEERASLGQEEYWVGEVSTEIPAYQSVREEFNLPRDDPVVLRMPARGDLSLRLVDYPAGVVPQLIDVEGRGEDMAAPSVDSIDGKFLFEDLVIGQAYRVFFYIEKDEAEIEGHRSFSLTHLAEQIIAGPELPQGVTERSLQYQRDPGIYGRFVLPEHRRGAVSFMNARDFTAKGIADRSFPSAETLDLSVFPDGSFIVSLAPGNSADGLKSLREFHTVAWEWWPHRFSWANPGNELERRTLFASRAIEFEPGAEILEIGEVHLEEDPYLLHISVKDAQGEPISGVYFTMVGITENQPDGAPLRRAKGSHQNTNEMGEIWVQDLDWYSRCALPAPGSAAFAGETIREIKVTALHGEYAMAEQRVQLNQRELSFVLERSGSAEGSVLPCKGLNELWIVWLPVNEALDHDRTNSVSGNGYRHALFPLDQNPIRFVSNAIPEGQWDVVFAVGSHHGHEALRIPAVEIHGGEVCKDPRLQNIDLNDLITTYRVKFRTADGDPITPPKMRGRLHVPLAPGQFAGRQFHWNTGGINFAEPLGFTLEGWITDKAWLSVDLGQLSAGENEVTVYPRREQSVQAQLGLSLEEGSAWSLQLLSQVPPQGPITIDLDRSGLGRVELPGVGPYELRWQATVQGEAISTEPIVRTFTLAELTGEAPINFQPPAPFVARLREDSGL